MQIEIAVDVLGFLSREGVIIECPLKDLFNNPCDIISQSRMAVRKLEDDNDERTLGTQK